MRAWLVTNTFLNKPLTVTEKVQSLVLPLLSVALYWIVWDPWLKRLPGAGPWLRDTVRPLGTLSVAVGTLQLTTALVTASSATTEMELGHELKLGAWVSDYKSMGNNQLQETEIKTYYNTVVIRRPWLKNGLSEYYVPQKINKIQQLQ